MNWNKNKVERRFSFMNIIDQYKNNKLVQLFGWFGKRSLLIYILHFVINNQLQNIHDQMNQQQK